MPIAVPGLVRCSSRHRRRRRLRPQTLRSGASLARPKSRILACPRLVTKMLAGLMSRWTMPFGVRGVERVGDLDGRGPASVSSLQRAAADAVLQRQPSSNSMTMKGLAVVLADVVDGADVGMVQRRGGAGFALEALQRLRSRASSSGRNFRATKRPGGCLRPRTPRPCRRRPASRQCGSAKWSAPIIEQLPGCSWFQW